MKKVLIALALIPALIWGLWIAIPESYLRDSIGGSLNDNRFSLETDGLKKMLFYKFTIDRMTLKGYGKEQASFQNITATIGLPAFIRFQLNVSFHGDVGRGTISGNVIRTLNEKKTDMAFENVHISDMPFLNNAGIQGSGVLSGSLTMNNGAGHIEFITNDAEFQPVVLSDIIVPLNLFHTARGALDVKAGMVRVTSLALEGKDIYARLTGRIDSTLADLSMEIMPEGPFLDNPLFITSLERYKVSPGYYVLHIKRDLRSLMSS